MKCECCGAVVPGLYCCDLCGRWICERCRDYLSEAAARDRGDGLEPGLYCRTCLGCRERSS